MPNLKAIYAKGQPFYFLKSIWGGKVFNIWTIMNGVPNSITESTGPRALLQHSITSHSNTDLSDSSRSIETEPLYTAFSLRICLKNQTMNLKSVLQQLQCNSIVDIRNFQWANGFQRRGPQTWSKMLQLIYVWEVRMAIYDRRKHRIKIRPISITSREFRKFKRGKCNSPIPRLTLLRREWYRQRMLRAEWNTNLTPHLINYLPNASLY